MKTHCVRGHKRIPENLYPNGGCRVCTKLRNDSPEMKSHCTRYRSTPEGKTAIGVNQRRHKYKFDTKDELRFQTLLNCDFCGLPLNGETPHVDHDHSCCDGKNSCGRCRRGFVHGICNRHWIPALEWYEKSSGITDPLLRKYREKFSS